MSKLRADATSIAHINVSLLSGSDLVEWAPTLALAESSQENSSLQQGLLVLKLLPTRKRIEVASAQQAGYPLSSLEHTGSSLVLGSQGSCLLQVKLSHHQI